MHNSGVTTPRKPGLSVYKENGQYFRREITEEDLDKREEFVNSIVSFIRSSCEVVPSPGELEISQDKIETLTLWLGQPSLAAVVTAQTQKLPLYSDDQRLRAVAKGEFGVDGFCTQSLVSDLCDRRFLTQDQRNKLVVNLTTLNYHFVFMDASDVVWALEETGAAATPEVRNLFERLQGDQCDEDPAINLVAEVLKKVWLEKPILRSKPWIMHFALTCLLVGRPPARVLRKLEAAIRARFHLVPQHADQLLNEIGFFFSQRFGRP